MTRQSRLVYSTEGNNSCPVCGKVLRKCNCTNSPDANQSSDNVIRVRRESKGRGGKQVTVISGLPADTPEPKALLKRIKARCGTGGTLKKATMEIQGDHRDEIAQLLTDAGYQVKRSGG